MSVSDMDERIAGVIREALVVIAQSYDVGPSTISRLTLDVLADIARTDHDARRRRQMAGIERAKADWPV
jgi:hypothetical protein